MPIPLGIGGFFLTAGIAMNKCIDNVKLHLPDVLKQDLQNEAMRQDRAVSELVRQICEAYLYGHRSGRPRRPEGAERGGLGRRASDKC